MVATPKRTTPKRPAQGASGGQPARYQRARIGSGGRLVIPADIRKELGLNEGEPVVLRVENGELHITNFDEVIRRIQEHARRYVQPGQSVVDEFIAERRAEAARE